MQRPQRRVWTDLLAGSIGLFAALIGWKTINDSSEHDSISLSPKWILAGAVGTITQRVIFDRNVAGVRDSRLRKYSAEMFWGILVLKALPNRDEVTYNYGLGSSMGAICYRLWYGVLNPIPE